MLNSIVWPEAFKPGMTDNFVSNEIIVSGLDTADIWSLLSDTSHWPSYYSNAADIVLLGTARTNLREGDRFQFTTFGLPIEAVVRECVAPDGTTAARLAWHGWSGEADERIDAYHAWLIEDLPEDRIRILTQETQMGGPAKVMASTVPNPMLNAHQEWLEGLAKAARKHAESN